MGRVNVKKLVEEFGGRKREKKNKKKKIRKKRLHMTSS